MAETAGIKSNFAGLDVEKLGLPDEQITNRINVEAYVDRKWQSLSHHRTQLDPNSPFARLPEEIMREWRRIEYFAWVAGVPLDTSDSIAANDLFAGLR